MKSPESLAGAAPSASTYNDVVWELVRPSYLAITVTAVDVVISRVLDINKNRSPFHALVGLQAQERLR